MRMRADLLLLRWIHLVGPMNASSRFVFSFLALRMLRSGPCGRSLCDRTVREMSRCRFVARSVTMK